MKAKVFFGIAIRLIILFVVAMLFTYLPATLREFFGDKPCNAWEFESYSTLKKINCNNCCGGIDSRWEWGVRHYWYHVLTIILFILSLANVVMQCLKLIKNEYNIKY